MDSAKLEEKYLENDKDVVEFTAGSQSYSLSFQGINKKSENESSCSQFYAFLNIIIMTFFTPLESDMIQTNKRYGTKRVVRRRPRFVSAAEVRTAKKRYSMTSQLHC